MESRRVFFVAQSAQTVKTSKLLALLYPSSNAEKNLSGWKPQPLTLPETNSLHLKMDDCKTIFLLGRPIFRGYVSCREGSNYSNINGTVEKTLLINGLFWFL